jgi:hypothetical protein
MLRRLNRRALLAAAMTGIVATSLPALAQNGDDAIAFVKSVYKLKGLWTDVAAKRSQYLTPEFVAAIDENDKYNRELDYAVDYDPLVQAQDFGVLKNFKLTLESANLPKATVRASFVNLDRPTAVRFDLVKTADGWRIADLYNPGGASLRQEYEDLNRKARAAAAKN